ncbi:putative sulfate exporter family transporter [Galactobacter valiniphilus]|uniref:Putative sulfate exporter family transporter n=1 Tax=Galactobacter valiniphilus TaxID=2676122 RepID=A0A399JEK7_9MICC|nr:putative sulfate exporter family transporter [Galactobacter valiniphilus]RII43654.1 putative sulfate exporter family transporter [Galactobacter valiniphilus]
MQNAADPQQPVLSDQERGVPSAAPATASPRATRPGEPGARASAWPGLLVSGAVGAACLALGNTVPGLSAMLVAVLLGALWRNLLPVPAALEPGIAIAAKRVLRWGVVLLGLQLSLPAILALGPGVLVVAVAAVALTFFATLALGRVLKVDPELTLLIASGFSICGAAAVAGVQGAVRASQEKVAAAVALVVLFGTLMIPLMPALVALLGLGPGDAGTIIGGATHEVAQVVAAGGIAGGAAVLAVAVPVKLARVLLMAPVVAGVSLAQRRKGGAPKSGEKRPPLVPLFVLGFVAMVLVATTSWVPAPALHAAKLLQQFLLATAMFALGLGVHVKSLVKLGGRPVVLGALSTLVIIGVVLLGIALGGGAIA